LFGRNAQKLYRFCASLQWNGSNWDSHRI